VRRGDVCADDCRRRRRPYRKGRAMIYVVLAVIFIVLLGVLFMMRGRRSA
jgi:predicted nucleic acid-binding Zn ribbon protein